MTHKRQNIKKIVLVVLSLLGVLIMGYLLSLHFSEEGGSFCNLGEGLSCDIVNKSIYSTIMGIPMSLLGLLYFIAVFVGVIKSYDDKTLRIIALATVAFLGPSLYLTIIELTVIKSICVFCEGSKILMIIIAAISWKEAGKLKSKHFIGAVIVGVVMAMLTFWVHSTAVPSDEYNEFAQCLHEKNFIMYGSITCSFCLKQRGIFGDAF